MTYETSRVTTTKMRWRIYAETISLFALIPLQISRTSSSKTIFKPDDANGENSAQIIFYNRIPKTGSTTFTNAIAYDLCLQNQFHVAHLNLTRNRFQMGRIDQLKLARNVTRWTKMQPLFLHGHVAFINFQSLGLPSPIWINILREPFERFVSHYYFLRYGDNFRVGLKRSKAGNNETFDDCFIRGSKECQPNAIWLQVHYFCGTASFCSEPGSAQALEQAKRHLLDHYLLVGVTERMGEMVELLDQMVPRFFRGAGQHFRTLDTIRAHLRHTTKKVAPSEEVERRFKAHPIYQAEREFYDFAAKEFDAVWRRVTDRGEAKANGKESDDGGGNDDTGMKTKFLLDQFHFEKIRP